MTPEKLQIQEKAIESAKWQLNSQYKEISAAYRGANLLAQDEAMGGGEGSAGLDEPPLIAPRV